MDMRKASGFTMIELMIVAGVILIIVAIVIPNMLRARVSGNEATAVTDTRTIATAQSMFQTAAFLDADGNGVGDYGNLTQLGNPDGAGATPPFLDSVLASGVKSGYTYTLAVTPGSATVAPAYTCLVVPITPGRSGVRQFFVDETGVIRYTTDGSAVSATSDPL